jgi:hypothetical protein
MCHAFRLAIGTDGHDFNRTVQNICQQSAPLLLDFSFCTDIDGYSENQPLRKALQASYNDTSYTEKLAARLKLAEGINELCSKNEKELFDVTEQYDLYISYFDILVNYAIDLGLYIKRRMTFDVNLLILPTFLTHISMIINTSINAKFTAKNVAKYFRYVELIDRLQHIDSAMQMHRRVPRSGRPC